MQVPSCRALGTAVGQSLGAASAADAQKSAQISNGERIRTGYEGLGPGFASFNLQQNVGATRYYTTFGPTTVSFYFHPSSGADGGHFWLCRRRVRPCTCAPCSTAIIHALLRRDT